MEGGRACIKRVCVCVCTCNTRVCARLGQLAFTVCLLSTLTSFHSSSRKGDGVCVCVCQREGGGRRRGGTGRFVCAACHGSFSRHIAFVAWKINTSQYLRTGLVISVVLTHNYASRPDHLTSGGSPK